MKFVTDFADQAVILPIAVAIGIGLLLAGWRRGAVSWGIAVAGTLGAVLLGKLVLHAGIADLRSPSGHTASAALVYGGLIALLLPAPMHGAPRQVAALLLAAAFAALVGGTRLALHLHSLADVAAGACLGIAGALALGRFAGPRPPGLRAAIPVAAALAVVLLLHGRHLHAEQAIDRIAARVWPVPLAPAPQPASALP